jgi:glutaminyl-tRNA synthetase
MRRRGYPARAIVNFCESVGISKANSLVDFSMLEHCVRTELQPSSIMLMAVLNPIEVLITNYPDDSTEYLVIDNHAEDKDKGSRLAPFSNKLYIEAEDFMEEAPKKFFRLSINKEVRLKGAYIIRCDEVIKDNRGNIVRLHCTYDKMTKSGLNLTDRKVKGVIHWVSAKHAVKCSVRLFEPLILDDDTKKLNEHSLTTLDNVYIEPEVLNLDRDMTFQFLRKGYFKADESYDKLIFNRIVGLKSSYNP